MQGLYVVSICIGEEDGFWYNQSTPSMASKTSRTCLSPPNGMIIAQFQAIPSHLLVRCKDWLQVCLGEDILTHPYLYKSAIRPGSGW